LVTSTTAAPIMRTMPATVKMVVPMPPVDGSVEPELLTMSVVRLPSVGTAVNVAMTPVLSEEPSAAV
jgi:hypothetical protein